MGEEADKQGDPTAAMSATPSRPRFDETIRLDRSIVFGEASLPTHFGRYRVLNRIGIGGFASVYAAVDPELESPVAVKVLAENHSADVEVRRRFVAEARVARRIGSDRLIGVFDMGETDDGRPYVVMELADRGTLRARLASTGRPSRAALLRLISELGECMDAIHTKGVVHRDIKPTNLLLRSSGNGSAAEPPTELIADDERLLLADFGLARDISGGASALTVGGGTAGYMAPEQGDPRGKADHRADIYAATVVVAELTTGRHAERLDLDTAGLPVAVLDALKRSLSMDRERRPATATAWRDELLAAYRDDAPTSVIRPNPEVETQELDLTEIQVPYPHDGNPSSSTLIPAPAASPPPATDRRPADQPPPPPPSLPIHPRLQPPPPPRPAIDPNDRANPAAAPPPTPGPGTAPPAAGVGVPRTPRPPPPLIGPAGEVLQGPSHPVSPSRPVDPGRAPQAPGPAPPVGGPPPGRPPAGRSRSPRPLSEQRSKEHLRTATRLAKLEQKASRKRARRERRVRRVLRIANFFLAIMRGILAMLLALVVGTLVVANQNDDLGFTQIWGEWPVRLQLIALAAFFLGMAYFPWPRSFEV